MPGTDGTTMYFLNGQRVIKFRFNIRVYYGFTKSFTNSYFVVSLNLVSTETPIIKIPITLITFEQRPFLLGWFFYDET